MYENILKITSKEQMVREMLNKGRGQKPQESRERVRTEKRGESQTDIVEGVGEEGGVDSTTVCYGDIGRGRIARTYVSIEESMLWGFMTYRGISGTGYSGTRVFRKV
jgi:hypothetical protein